MSWQVGDPDTAQPPTVPSHSEPVAAWLRCDGLSKEASLKGRYVVGTSKKSDGSQAFIWDAARGMRGLGHLQQHKHSHASGISDDRRIVVGGSGKESQEAFIWEPAQGMRRLQTLAEDAQLDLSDWLLTIATDISADGRTVVGSGTNPQGKTEGWIMRLADRDD